MKNQQVNNQKMESLRSDVFAPLSVEESKRLVGGRIKLVTMTEQPNGSYERDDDL